MVGAVVVVFPPVPILFGDGAHADTYFLFVRVLLAEQASRVPTGHCAGGRVVVLQSLRWRRGDNFLTTEVDVHRYPTQRPELNMHAFTPLLKDHSVHIFRRKE